MAVKRYDGSQWVTVAGKGDQGTSSSIATWVKTATGGETSVSGNDDNSQPLSYTVGQELVFINGALQKRGADYTATTGNSITGLTALAANDVVTVWTVNAFSVTNAISNTLVDAKGDLIVATGADTPGILTAGTTGQVLTVDSTTGTGLKWATPAAGGKVLQVVQGTTTTSTTISSTTLTDTSLSVSITPSANTSKILILVTQTLYLKRDAPATDVYARMAILRNSTAVFETNTINVAGFDQGGTTSTSVVSRTYASFQYLDSPSTTSAITYKTQGNVHSTTNSGQVVFQESSGPSQIICLEIGA